MISATTTPTIIPIGFGLSDAGPNSKMCVIYTHEEYIQTALTCWIVKRRRVRT